MYYANFINGSTKPWTVNGTILAPCGSAVCTITIELIANILVTNNTYNYTFQYNVLLQNVDTDGNIEIVLVDRSASMTSAKKALFVSLDLQEGYILTSNERPVKVVFSDWCKTDAPILQTASDQTRKRLTTMQIVGVLIILLIAVFIIFLIGRYLYIKNGNHN